MQSLARKLAVKIGKRQSGFTLVELLVIVGIIVALGSVIVPNVLQFADKGVEGAEKAEEERIGTAIHRFMAAYSPAPITALPGTPGADFNYPGGDSQHHFGPGRPLDLSELLRTTDTNAWYCWDSSGQITQIDTTSSQPCL